MAALVALLALLLAGCGDDAPVTAEASEPEQGLADMCSEIKSAVDYEGDIPDGSTATATLARLRSIEARGDAEVDALVAWFKTGFEAFDGNLPSVAEAEAGMDSLERGQNAYAEACNDSL